MINVGQAVSHRIDDGVLEGSQVVVTGLRIKISHMVSAEELELPGMRSAIMLKNEAAIWEMLYGDIHKRLHDLERMINMGGQPEHTVPELQKLMTDIRSMMNWRPPSDGNHE